VASSGRPFNIIVGQDLNGDTLFTDRLAFATDLNRPSVRQTAFGEFDLAPLPGQALIPRNSGLGPGAHLIEMRVSKTFKGSIANFGRRRLIRWIDANHAGQSKGRHYSGEVILLAVRWYLRYPLAYEHVPEMLAERGLEVDASCVLCAGTQ
jgi:hypothetical protein